MTAKKSKTKKSAETDPIEETRIDVKSFNAKKSADKKYKIPTPDEYARMVNPRPARINDPQIFLTVKDRRSAEPTEPAKGEWYFHVCGVCGYQFYSRRKNPGNCLERECRSTIWNKRDFE